jgi:formylglycine-generating enzyme required for sulfatase activity
MFSRESEIVRDLDHVLVKRIVEQDASGNSHTYYFKRFKPSGISGGNVWADRENRFLMRFLIDKLRHVVQTKRIDSSTPGVIDVVETHDTGLTIEEWLQVTPRYSDGTSYSHPFRRADDFIRLLRACLVALQEIHAAGVIHCDIKQDNICLPCTPPYQPGCLLKPDFEALRLIDFSFSLGKTMPLQQILPINPSEDYQSPLLKNALTADHISGKPDNINKLDYRVDLYGLGYMGNQIIESGKLIWDGDESVSRNRLLRAVLDELIALGTERTGMFSFKGNSQPHKRLIATLDRCLKGVEAQEAFIPLRQDPVGAKSAPLKTPVTPLVISQPPADVQEQSAPLKAPVLAQQPPDGQRQAEADVEQPQNVMPGTGDDNKRSRPIFVVMAVMLCVYAIYVFIVQYHIANGKSIADTSGEKLEPVKVFRDCPDCPEMVVIPAGNFDMGSPDSEQGRNTDAGPVHHVTIENAFALGKTEVTQRQWRAVMGSNPSYFKKCGDNCPVEEVSWNDINSFITRLNKKTGKQYRLPSEAEWEYACRGGRQQRYCGSDNIDSVAWYDKNSNSKTHPVAGKLPNAYGLYDMSGNVWEWVEDGYHDSYQGAPTDGSTEGKDDKRVLRGGSWVYGSDLARSASRFRVVSSYRDGGNGFRVARMLP